MRYLLFAAAYLCLSGCATVTDPPKHVTNWSKMEVGMTKPQVIDLLGTPSLRVCPSQSKPQPDQSLIENIVGDAVVRALFDLWFERWHYGQNEPFENIFRPSDDIYSVYFNEQDRVVRFRKPVTESIDGNENSSTKSAS